MLPAGAGREQCLERVTGRGREFVLRNRVLIVGPCNVLLTGRWVLTGPTGLFAIGLAVALAGRQATSGWAAHHRQDAVAGYG